MEEMRADFQRSPQNGPIAATWAGGALGGLSPGCFLLTHPALIAIATTNFVTD